MTHRILIATGMIALLSACSSQPAPSGSNAAEQGYAAYRAGDLAAAETAYDTALAADPGNVAALVGLGEVYENTGRISEAIEFYTRAQNQRSGAIRIWNDGRVRQVGLNEFAVRRLGALGAGQGFYDPAILVETSVPEAAIVPVAEVGFEDPALQIPQLQYDPRPIENVQPEIQPVEVAVPFVAPEAISPFSEPLAPLPPVSVEVTASDPVIFSDPVLLPQQEIVALPQPNLLLTEPVQTYTGPVSGPLLLETEILPAPSSPQVTLVERPLQTPVPASKRGTVAQPFLSQPLPRTQPGYAVVNGDLVYISAEDIANGIAGAPLSEESAPVELNGISIPNLN